MRLGLPEDTDNARGAADRPSTRYTASARRTRHRISKKLGRRSGLRGPENRASGRTMPPMDATPGQAPNPNAPGEATALLGRIARGDAAAADELLPLVYDQLRAIAGSYFRGQRPEHTLQPTALVHEAYLKLINAANQNWNSRAHFCAVAATAMRQILKNHAAARRAAKRGGPGAQRLPLDQVTTPSGRSIIDVIALDEVLTRLATLNARQARVIELWFFAGFTMEEIAELVGVSTRTVERDWRQARAWLSVELAEFDE